MTPKTFLIGITEPSVEGMKEYLEHTDQMGFYNDMFPPYFLDGKHHPLEPLNLVSFYAKLCYKSLVVGKNENISKTRSIEANLKGCFDVGHGSVFEHVSLNFVTTGCSRIFTHELVRHRVGIAFSQTSGRYCTPEAAEMILPPEFDEVKIPLLEVHSQTGETKKVREITLREAFEKKLDDLKEFVTSVRNDILKVDDMPMSERKWWTSAIRRIMPNGCDNEIGWTVNIRSLRHLLEMRTAPSAEWEIRRIFTDVARIIEEKYPLMLYGGRKEYDEDNDFDIWRGLAIQPFDKEK